jgi:putative copper resistance protein D
MVTILLIVSRALHLGSGMLMVAVVAFRWFVLLPAFKRSPEQMWTMFSPLFDRLKHLLLWSGAILLVSGLMLFWSVSAAMSGNSLQESLTSETFGTVLFQTQFGSIFLWRLGLALFLAISLWRLNSSGWSSQRRRSPLEFLAGCTAAALIVLFSGTGHAAASSGSAFLYNLSADAVHILATSVWPGGLLPFAIFLAYARSIEIETFRNPVLAVAYRFSSASLIAVIVLAASGILNAYFLVGSFSSLFLTPYGQVLCFKLLLFAGIIGLASWNRFSLLPSLFDEKDFTAIPVLLRRLQASVLGEFALALAIVGVVSILGTLPPSR